MLMACVMIFATACGETKKEVSKSNVEDTDDDDKEEKEEKEEKKKEKKKNKEEKKETEEKKEEETPKKTGKTIEDYKSSSEWKAMVDTLNRSFADKGITMEIDAEGNMVIYTCTMDESMLGKNPDYDAVADKLEDYLDQNESTFQAQIAQMERDFGVDDVSVKVYYKVGNKVLVERMIYAADDAYAPATDDDDDKIAPDVTSGNTVEDYANSTEWKTMVKSVEDSLSGSGISMKITAEGNTVVYTCSIDKSVVGDADLDVYAKTLREYTLNMEDYYKEQIAQMEKGFGVSGISIRVIYKVGNKVLMDETIY